jgi:hypothetical protein
MDASSSEADSAPRRAARRQGEPNMIEARSNLANGSAGREFPLLPRSSSRESEPSMTSEESCVSSKAIRIPLRNDARVRRAAADILKNVQSRLPGRIRDLKVRIEDDQFVLSGVSTSYYVKQVAQHVAMNALDALMLGRLVNEIEVRTVR